MNRLQGRDRLAIDRDRDPLAGLDPFEHGARLIPQLTRRHLGHGTDCSLCATIVAHGWTYRITCRDATVTRWLWWSAIARGGPADASSLSACAQLPRVDLQGRVSGEHVKVAVRVQHRNFVADRDALPAQLPQSANRSSSAYAAAAPRNR